MIIRYLHESLTIHLDTLKPSFDGSDALFMNLPMNLGITEPTDPSIGLDEGVLKFSVEELKEKVFEPVVRDVLDLIHKQKQQTHNLKAIFTVGGFGASHYLQNRITEEYRRFGIKVVTPYRAGLHDIITIEIQTIDFWT